jgi:hypothetical protein
MLLGASLITLLLVRTAIAAAFGVAATRGFDWFVIAYTTGRFQNEGN